MNVPGWLRRILPPTPLERGLALQCVLSAFATGSFLTGTAVYFTQIVGLTGAQVGLGMSISGVVTYKKTEALAEAVRFAPLDRLLVETDSPYLAPVPYRGKKNEPAYVLETARRIAELKGLTLEQVAEATSLNAARVYRFQLPEV